ncbi:hypothetical protein D9611_006471 [Ephemerocybe angulata]|uniref:histone deacetylase n=1 Tax=Ephemerocybe angulata TaxID=980116 RepID=A0A8H5C970_9AGAR|nr:hypothetical protein D9611_006471 [Tulosesus angulatus]
MTSMDGVEDIRGKVAYVASGELAKLSSLLPSNRNRAIMVHSLINALGILKDNPTRPRRIQVVNPSRATRQALSTYHSKDYLDFILDASSQQKAQLEDSESNRLLALEFGLEDARLPNIPGALGLQVAIAWDGGRHHARKSKASGFCYVADCTLALLPLKRPTPDIPKPRIMYIDLDLHFSDGVSESFHSPNSTGSSQILTCSIHHTSPGFFPLSPLAPLPTPSSESFDPFTLSIPLQQGASSATFARIYPILNRAREIFNPDYIVLQCGVDSLAGDPYAVFNWNIGGEGSMGWYVDKIVNEWPGRKLLLGGGGYNSPNAARAWAYFTSIATGSPLDLDTEIPDHSAFPQYAPSFTVSSSLYNKMSIDVFRSVQLDVQAGFMQDTNTPEYLQSIEDAYVDILAALKSRLS